ncbi:MAG TPA: hypothetical protein P5279_06145 [Anaerohalosphaeraceae bacterium]|nr:hypothetical protein [Anaerohalosphaeraceae bacterium]HRT50053.1 hypothetical protein [Anaerohalosphaeraceae bacterium]HRT85856.1 hypothetical protein [Anaerohalosphaeraceae bacterium]
MKQRIRHPGVTLSEVLVVVAAMVLLTVLAVPATRKIVASFESASGVRRVIAAALANARAIAAKEQCYAGVRFQQDLNGDQYMIFIIHDPDDPAHTVDGIGTGLANGFRAVENRKPIRLPQTVGVMDLRLVTRIVLANNHVQYSEAQVTNDMPNLIAECSTFSIVFSPTGRLVLHEVRVRNRHGATGAAANSADDVFNTDTAVFAGDAMFMQDDYFDPLSPFRYGPEMSRNCFVIYDKKRLEAAPPSARWTTYLHGLDMIYINPHTGELVND